MSTSIYLISLSNSILGCLISSNGLSRSNQLGNFVKPPIDDGEHIAHKSQKPAIRDSMTKMRDKGGTMEGQVEI